MNIPSESARELALLEHIESNPDVTQASWPPQLGVAVGTVNWHIKRFGLKKGLYQDQARRAQEVAL